MTALSFFGCLTVAFGPILSIFIFHISHYPFLVFLVLESFIWLVTTLLSALISYYSFFNIEPTTNYYSTLLIFVVFQQISWYLAFKTTSQSQVSIGILEPTFLDNVNHALANGVGMGFAYLGLYYSTQLSESAGYGIIPSSTCPSLDLYFTTGITLMLLSLWNVILTIINFYGHAQNSKVGLLIILLSAVFHFVLAAIPKFFSESSNGCIYVFSIMSALVITSSFGIYRQCLLSIGEWHDERSRKKRKPVTQRD